MRACVGEGGGVKVERPQPEARTYDLDAGAGRRRLEIDDAAQLWPAWRAGFASVPSVRLLRMGQGSATQASLRTAVGA